MSDDEARDILQRTHEGFTITCQQCGSEDVGVNSDIGFSEVSGVWGSLFLHCAECGQRSDIWTP